MHLIVNQQRQIGARDILLCNCLFLPSLNPSGLTSQSLSAAVKKADYTAPVYKSVWCTVAGTDFTTPVHKSVWCTVVGTDSTAPVHKSVWCTVIIIIIHSFYIALFSALKQTHCVHWYVILNEWLYPFIACIINIHGSGVLIVLFGCCMAGATWNAAFSVQVLCTPFKHASGYSVTSFKAT